MALPICTDPPLTLSDSAVSSSDENVPKRALLFGLEGDGLHWSSREVAILGERLVLHRARDSRGIEELALLHKSSPGPESGGQPARPTPLARPQGSGWRGGLRLRRALLGGIRRGFFAAHALTGEVEDRGVVDEPVDSGHGGHRVFEDPVPLAEGQVGGDHDRFPLVALGQEGEEDFPFIAGLLHVFYFL